MADASFVPRDDSAAFVNKAYVASMLEGGTSGVLWLHSKSPALEPIDQLGTRNPQRTRGRREIALRTLHSAFQQRSFYVVERCRFDIAADPH
jgi:hypothetical protein